VTDVPVPYLDDLRFQELVDEAKRYIPVRAPAWTDHNVSDPGITLIEACAARVDQLSYRTNQVPDAVRYRLLRLAGLRPTPPVSARTQLTFARSGQPRRRTRITVPAGTAVSTSAAYPGPAITFRTVHDLVIRQRETVGVVEAVNVVTVDEVLGTSTGEPGQRFTPSGTPFASENLDGTQFAMLTVTVVDPDGIGRLWTQVSTFADADEYDSCFLWDAVAHQVAFGPRTRYATGHRHHGAVPVRGAIIQARYDTSQGSLGNIPANTLTAWDGSETVAVTNPAPTAGGVDAESVPEAVARTNAVLVPLDRAVTADDYALVLTQRVAGIARVRTAAVPGQPGPGDPGYLRVTVVPAPQGPPGEPLTESDLRLSDATAAAVGQCAGSVRLLCARVQIADPAWVPFSVTATVYSWASGHSPAGQAGRRDAEAALFKYFHPTLGGPGGTGWPFGRPVHVGDAYAVLAGLPDTITVVNVAIANQAGIPTSWIYVPDHGLPLLCQAQVVYVDSSTEERELSAGMWGLFDGADATGNLLGIFSGDVVGLETGIGLHAKSVVNLTSYTIEVSLLAATRRTRARRPSVVRQSVYPGTVANVSGVTSSVVVHRQVLDGTFCLYEHPARMGKQWLFWPADSPVDLASPGIGADRTVSSAFNRTARTVQLRGDAAASDAEQLVWPDAAADLSPALDDQARFAVLLDGPDKGHYSLTVTGARGVQEWVFNRGVTDLPAVLGPGMRVLSIANQTRYQVVLYPQPGFMPGAAGLQLVAPRSTAPVRTQLTGQVASAAIRPPGSVVAWGDQASGLTDIPSGLTDVCAVAAGGWHWLALRADGTVTAWGQDAYGQSSVPAGLRNVVAVAAGTWHSLALTADGTVTAWGDNSDGQAAVPAGLSDVVAIAAGGWHSLALTADGTVTAWGYQTRQGQAHEVPAGLSDVVAISTAMGHSLALRADGTVVAWGADLYGETAVPDDLDGVIAVAAGMWFSLALLADGTVTAWGYQTGEGGVNQVPPGLSGVVDIATSTAVATAWPRIQRAGPAGADAVPVPDEVTTAAVGAMRSLALLADGTIAGWGTGTGSGQPFAVPAVTVSRSVGIAVGEAYALAICVTQ